MNNPCNECIVVSMCMKECPKLVDFIKGTMKSYNIKIPYNFEVNRDLLRRLATGMRVKCDTDGGFYFLCFGLKSELLRLYVIFRGGEIMKMRLSNE